MGGVLFHVCVAFYLFEGICSEPVYLWVQEDRAELRSAKHVWGKDTHQSTDQLIAETHERGPTDRVKDQGSWIEFILGKPE